MARRDDEPFHVLVPSYPPKGEDWTKGDSKRFLFTDLDAFASLIDNSTIEIV